MIELQPMAGSEIACVPISATRPQVSVVLPVYEPNREHLAKALQSVLQQDLGREAMQIAVVDDASPTQAVATMLREIDPNGRIEHYRSAMNQGLAGCWNQCIRIARGEVVHLLHQDDWVSEGFYERLMPAFSLDHVGMAFCRYAIVEGEERIVRVSHRESWRAGVLNNWLTKIAEWQRIQCPSVLVRRSVYETLGGFRSDLKFALDWEMWVRIAAKFDVWYQPKRLAFYRRHTASETHRLNERQQSDLDVLKTIDVFADHLPTMHKEEMVFSAYASFALRTVKKTQRTTAKPGEQSAELLALLQNKLNSTPNFHAATKRLAKHVSDLKRLLRL